VKPVEEITVCVWDYGTFICLAEMFAKTCAKVYYHSPCNDEYRSVARCVIGDGLEEVEGFERMDDPFDPDILNEVDLHCFPDIGFTGEQKYLRAIGKSVWGSMGADELELYRTRFLKTIKGIGLKTVKSVTIKGLTNLDLHLREVEDKWIKVNRFRENMETWHHQDYTHSQRNLEHLASEFGGCKEQVVFIVQDQIDTDLEIGYDGWNVDGEFPTKSFQGYEAKNELYLGSWLDAEDLPDAVKEVNGAISPLLKQYGYRNFVATELRIKDDVPYFIDPTLRMAGQTQEHLTNTCANFADVIWHGANGELIEPEFKTRFAAEATMHHTGPDGNKTLVIPPKIKENFKLYGYCYIDGAYQFPKRRNDEVGVVCGNGDTIKEAIENLRDNFDELSREPVSIDYAGFIDLLGEVKSAEDEGVHFTDQKIPNADIILED
jgi:hypothetical protein